jgi:hypothetical protein
MTLENLCQEILASDSRNDVTRLQDQLECAVRDEVLNPEP